MKMNREIKFRAWEKKLKEMVRVDDISFEWRQINTASAWRHYDEVELMQCSGLKDKNGVEIYEGDIVERMYIFKGEYGETHMGEVVYDKEYARYVISRPNKHIEPKTEDLRNTLSDKCTYEVIGNIYENPELLEVEL